MEEFTYSPLEAPKAQIRLVDLVPLSNTSEPHQQQLRCSIRTIYLKDDPNRRTLPKYTALSYTWGKQSRSSQLIVNGGACGLNQGEAVINITPSLETALLQLRNDAALLQLRDDADETETILLWIDQLCINQDNSNEKNVQVPLMKEIYEKAIDVLVWLGPATDGTNHLVHLFKILNEVGKRATQIERLYSSTSTSKLTQLYNATLTRLRKRSSLGPKFAIPTESLRGFVNFDWWTRVWVVQEISVASSVKFAYGAERITYEHLRNALRFYAFDIWMKSNTFQNRHWLLKLFTIQTILALQKAPYDSAASQMLSSSYKYKENTGGHDLLHILEMSHVIRVRVRDPNIQYRLQATQDRDLIYGLLGLAKDKMGINPHYEEGVQTSAIYREVATSLLKAGHVDMLWFCQFPKSKPKENVPELPSWTPDWAGYIQTPYGSDFSSTSHPFAASGKRKADVRLVESDEGCIKLKGVLVGEVVVIGQLWGEIPGLQSNQTELKQPDLFSKRAPQLKTAMPFLEELNLFFDQAMSNTSGPDPETIEEARWRTPIGDKEMEDNIGGSRRATSQSCETYLEVCRRIEIQKKRPVPSEKPRQRRKFRWLRVLGFLLWIFVRFLFRSLLRLFLMKKMDSKRDDSFAFPSDRGGSSYMSFMQQMYGRRAFRTENGYVGLGPAGMTTGDNVCIIFGAQVPYVLRPDGKGRYQLVGEAYIHGIMDGELIEKRADEVDFTIF
ncbi:HET-domain-containing protein [Stipitochalara longipes BDJ]|nr:HET-domain-containing protein [Stipitochalara longipes BDJ]